MSKKLATYVVVSTVFLVQTWAMKEAISSKMAAARGSLSAPQFYMLAEFQAWMASSVSLIYSTRGHSYGTYIQEHVYL